MIETLLAYFWAPVLLYALSLGAGLLAERAARVTLPCGLLAPLGLALIVVVGLTAFRLDVGSVLATPLVAAAALAGFPLARGSLRERVNPGWAGAAALATYALYLAPVALSGHWTWAGYNFVNDTANNFVFADLLLSEGVGSPDPKGSTTAAVAATPGALGYPLGAHGLLAAVKPLTGASIAAIYQPLISFAAAMAALSMAQLARRSGLVPLAAAATAFLAATAGLIYRYSLHGGIKEILVVAFLATAVALAREGLEDRMRPGWFGLTGMCVAALVHVFGAISFGYALALGGVSLAAALLWPGRTGARRLGVAAVAGVAAALVFSLASLSATLSFTETASETFASSGGARTAELGHLLRPLPLEQTVGVWLARDYRGPVQPGLELENTLMILVALALALIGGAFDLRDRRPSALLLLLVGAMTAAVLGPRLSPYADSKLLVVLSPAVVLLAAVGAFRLFALATRVTRIVGGAGAVLLAIGVLASAALGYNAVRLAPPERFDAMEDAAGHARGGGLWLVNEWEEFARYFMRDIRNNSAFESESPRSADLREPAPLFGYHYDLDAERISYVTSFPGIIKRRAPDASRPPASFRLVYANEYYEVWRRQPRPRVRAHIPLQVRHRATAVPSCALVRRIAGRAGPRERLVAAQRPESAQMDTATVANRPPGWPPDPANPGLVAPVTPGRAGGLARVAPGSYDVWVRGSLGRPVAALVDGREVGAAEQVNSPGQWLRVGQVRLRGGIHMLELERPGGGIGPGNGYPGEFGPLALEPVEPRPRLMSVRPRDAAARLCGKRWDWIELVSGDA